MQQIGSLDAVRLASRLIDLVKRTGLPVTLLEQGGEIQVGVLNLIDLDDEDWFQQPISIDRLTEGDSADERA